MKNEKNSQGSLFLCPEQYDFNVDDISIFISSLQEIDFIGQEIQKNNISHHFFTGNKYLDYIAYLGCAPNIQFERNKTNNKFCQINTHSFLTPHFSYSETQTFSPHCPQCKKAVKDWKSNKTSSTILCSQCHTRSNIADYNLRKMAGYARLFIEITDIFPKEAIPQHNILEKLTLITGIKWLYFYNYR